MKPKWYDKWVELYPNLTISDVGDAAESGPNKELSYEV